MYVADFISIHAAREGGDIADFNKFTQFHISIHAAREGGDRLLCELYLFPFVFQSTPPVKAATTRFALFLQGSSISIHAAREGGDMCK